MWEVSVVSLSITSVLCVVGVLSNSYDDSLGQRVAMGLIAISAASRGVAIFQTHLVDFDWTMLHIGIAVFSLSTAYRYVRLYQHRSESRRSAR